MVEGHDLLSATIGSTKECSVYRDPLWRHYIPGGLFLTSFIDSGLTKCSVSVVLLLLIALPLEELKYQPQLYCCNKPPKTLLPLHCRSGRP